MLGSSVFLRESAKLLAGENASIWDIDNMVAVLEDTSNPVTARQTERLFQSVISKAHVNFDDIPESKGNVEDYKGYPTMKDTLYTMRQLAEAQKATSVKETVEIVEKALANLVSLAPLYQKGFQVKSDYVMLEYNTFVCCCVEATTSVLCSFVDYMKRPDSSVMEIKLVNTKYRANNLYLEQLKKFNRINETMDYRKFLEQMCSKGRENFVGAEVVGLTAIMLVAISIVPITRTLIYQFYNLRRKLSDSLNMQAMFLELHKTCVEANTDFTKEKKEKILRKQDALRKTMLKLADKIKVTDVKASRQTASDLNKDNKLMTFDNVKKDIDNSDFSLL